VLLLWFVLYAFQAAGTIVLIVFMYTAASHARDLRLPARLTPIWAVFGWIVPVVNLWFPYWVLRDCLPPQETKQRNLLLRWWVLQILSYLFVFIVLIARWANPLLGALFIAGEAGYAFLQASSGTRAIARICKTHETLVSALVAPGPYQVR
jgi:hypothetical protein